MRPRLSLTAHAGSRMRSVLPGRLQDGYILSCLANHHGNLRPYFRGGVALGGGPLDSHETKGMVTILKQKSIKKSITRFSKTTLPSQRLALNMYALLCSLKNYYIGCKKIPKSFFRWGIFFRKNKTQEMAPSILPKTSIRPPNPKISIKKRRWSSLRTSQKCPAYISTSPKLNEWIPTQKVMGLGRMYLRQMKMALNFWGI